MPPSSTSPVSADLVRELSRALGIVLGDDRLDAVAERFAELLALAEPLQAIDLGVRAPDAHFDPSWNFAESTGDRS